MPATAPPPSVTYVHGLVRPSGVRVPREWYVPDEAYGWRAVAVLFGVLLGGVAALPWLVDRWGVVAMLGFTFLMGWWLGPMLQYALHFRNGEQASGDLLIGADGIGSVVRRLLHPGEPPPRSSGIVAVRGAVHDVIHHLGPLGAIYYLGPGVESVIARASDTGIYWFLSLARELVPGGMTDPAAVLAHMAAKFDHSFRAVTSATDELRFDELFDRDPIPFWSQGAVTLLGDAAHPLLPHTGQGAAQAIVDGVTLGRVLAGRADIPGALRAYEAERRPKTTTLLGQGRRTARVMRTRNPVACAVREAVIRAIPAATIARLVVRINRRAGTDVRGDSSASAG